MATHRNHATTDTQRGLYMALELSQSKWKLGFASEAGGKPRRRTIDARDLGALRTEIAAARRRLGLPAHASVRSCYEAGRDGFWLHRCLSREGIDNSVVDSSSIEVNRRRRRAKSDGVDVAKLLSMLMRYHGGERWVWSVVNVPAPADEADRQPHRELLELRKDRTRHVNRIKGLLAAEGIEAKVGAGFESDLDRLRTWDDRPLAQTLVARLRRECERLRLAERHIRELERQREAAIAEVGAVSEAKTEQVRRLLSLRGIGLNSSWLYVMEVFGWREVRNGKQLGSLTGLTPTPYASGEVDREQGIDKAGNRRMRAMAVEIAWCWLRYQPDSELSRWFQRRFGGGSKRMRRIGIVALARKLLVRLWRYLQTGVLPPGAVRVDWRSKLKRATA